MSVLTEPLSDVKHRLDSWKAIAIHINREIRTAQRWEKFEGLPVHRHFHRKGKTVYAFKCEIDAWLRSRRFDGSGVVENSAMWSTVGTSSS